MTACRCAPTLSWVSGSDGEVLRAAKPDEDSAKVELRAGVNSIVVEVSQADTAWGLYLRLQDEAGRKLRLTDVGTLEPLEGVE